MTKYIRSCTQGHDDFFKRGVSSTLPYPIDGDFDLTGTALDRCQGISRRHAKIIVAMGTQGDIFNPWNMLTEIAEERFIFMRQRITNGIRNVNGCRPRLNSNCKDVAQKIPITTGRIFSRELYGW